MFTKYCKVISILVATLVNPVLSWGAIGHTTIAQLSQTLLTPTSNKFVSSLIPDGNMSAVADWADQIRINKNYQWSEPLHFIDTPDWQCSYYYEKNCFNQQGEFNFCVDGAIRNYTSLLETNPQPDDLKFLIHFIGDIHQPLHCGFIGDRGGNTIKIKFLNRHTELHALWDSGLIQYRIKQDFENSQQQWVNYLQSILNNNKYYNQSNSEIWGNESAQLACNNSYVHVNGDKIENNDILYEDYYSHNINIIESQIISASKRLAYVLNNLV
jgi:hypothetical protein